MLYFFIFLFILVIVGIIISIKDKIKAKKYGAKENYVAIHYHGMPYVKERAYSTIFITDEKMIVECQKKKFELNLNRIIAAEALRKTDLLKKDKSVIGRGIVGGLVLGPLGAIVGGMSGIGKKNKKGEFLVVNYISSVNEQINVLIFDMNKIAKAKKIAKSLSRNIIENKPPDGVIEL